MDFIFDFETMGQNVRRCPAINVAAAVFDKERFIDNPYTYDEILSNIKVFKLDVQDQVRNYNYVIEPSSIEFWNTVSDDAKKQLRPTTNDLTLSIFCDKFIEYLKQYKIKHWWSRSNTFDPVILHRIFDDNGRTNELDAILKFWLVRDIRTYIDAKTDFSLNHNGFIPVSKQEWDAKFRLHDSKHDVTADILRFQKLTRIEHGLD